jgi:hypothetical protein
MERIELMVVEGVNRLREGRLSPHRPDGYRRRLTDERMLWNGTVLMRFTRFLTIK